LVRDAPEAATALGFSRWRRSGLLERNPALRSD